MSSDDSALIDAFRPLRAALIPAAYVELAFNGLYSGLYILTVYALIYKRGTYGFNWAIFFALTSMYILSSIHAINGAVLVQFAFVEHGDTIESSIAYIAQPSLPRSLLGAIALTINTMIADFVLIWRCWTIWNRNWKIIIFPLSCTLVGAGLGFRGIAAQVAFVNNPLSSPATYINFGNGYFGLILATTASATSLIIFRIFKKTEQSTRRSMGYDRVVEVIVESAVLYLVTLCVYIPLSVQGMANVSYYPQALVAQLTGIAPTLLVARVAFGLSRPEATWQSDSAGHAFRRGGNSTSGQQSTIVLTTVSRSEHTGTKFEAIHDV
ncbi:hypothetical protein B0H16DRAFT_1723589 [Mycena metata]|uniref:Uncharacterized protein n=1 Tax=Mycena metata TaxID=1033252 RepID=A0AAD7IZP5_9AGAR|nr:hypothetical protein B0H16DRAFT_1723589 [Mycena metata]